MSYVRGRFLRPTLAATAPRSAVAELGVVRRRSHIVKDTAIEDLPEQPTGSPDAIALFPDFVLGAMARRGPGVVESVHLDLPRAQPTRWVFHPASSGGVETIAETHHTYFRTILARFAHLSGISPYGGDAELSVSVPSLGTHHFSVALCNSQQTGYSVCVHLHAVPASPNSQFDRNA